MRCTDGRFTIAQFNANFLLGHIHLVKAQLSTHFYHIICVSETWLHSQISVDLIKLDDYLLIRNDREGKRGGGVACYVHESLQVRVLAASPSPFSNAPCIVTPFSGRRSVQGVYWPWLFTGSIGTSSEPI